MGRKRKSAVVVLPEEFVINSVEGKFGEFKELLADERPVVLDFSQVASLDYAALQLVYSFCFSCREKDLDFSVENISPKIEKKITLCGFQKYLLKEGANGSV